MSRLSLFKSFKDGLNEFVMESDGGEELMDEQEETIGKVQLQQSAPPHPQNSQTVVSRGMTLSGTLRGKGVVKVEGTVEGEVVLDGTITVSAPGVVKGPVTANIIRVFGKIQGNVTAKERLYLEKTGYLEGDIETAALVVEDGGQFNGRAIMAKKLDKIVSYTYYAAYSTLSDVSRQLLGDFDPNNEVYMAIHKPAFVEKLFNSFFGKAVAAGDEVPVNWDFAQVDCDVCITTAYSGWLEDCVATSYDSEGFPKTFACPYFDGADILQHSRLPRNTNFKECGNALGADGTPGQGPMTYAYRSDVAARSPFKNIYKTTCNYPCYTQEQYNNFDNANTDLEPCIGENCNCGSYVETEYRVYTNSFPCGTTYGVPDPGLCITCPSGYRIKRGSGYSEEAPLKNISCVPINPQPPVNDDTTPTTPDDSNNPDNSGGHDNTGGDTVTEPTCDIPTPSLDATPCGKRWDGSPEVCGFVDINRF